MLLIDFTLGTLQFWIQLLSELDNNNMVKLPYLNKTQQKKRRDVILARITPYLLAYHPPRLLTDQRITSWIIEIPSPDQYDPTLALSNIFLVQHHNPIPPWDIASFPWHYRYYCQFFLSKRSSSVEWSGVLPFQWVNSSNCWIILHENRDISYPFIMIQCWICYPTVVESHLLEYPIVPGPLMLKK